ncbi:MAG: efflux RND transporter periplasmic adaptor subunit [Rhodospirillales bacterium]|nr:efflux RND transporter periplasmic adaptor subunit [Rhodospirillales bacterium]
MKKAVIVILLFCVIGAGVYMWTGGDAGNSDAGAGGGGMPGQGGPLAVTVMTLSPQDLAFTHELPGRISAYRQSQVRPQVDGIVTERLFEEGADVEKGQQLYQIDDARYKAALNSALADLKSAEASVKTVEARAGRYKQLVKINAVSKQEYDDVKAELDQANAAIAVAQAAVDVAQVNLDYTKVYAPISGRIGKSLVTEGALVTANQQQTLAVITQLDPVYIDMQQSGQEAMQLRARMPANSDIPVRLILDETTGQAYPLAGTLKFSEVTIDETTGSIALRALMPNPESILLPGLFVRASLDLGNRRVLTVPQRAATRLPSGGLQVWVVDAEQKAQPRPLTVEQAYKDQWIVRDGVSEGDTIIITGYQKAGPGTLVTPTPWVPEVSGATQPGQQE